jgi:hypothetical protein
VELVHICLSKNEKNSVAPLNYGAMMTKGGNTSLNVRACLKCLVFSVAKFGQAVKAILRRLSRAGSSG